MPPSSKRKAASVPERLFAWYLADPQNPVLIGEIGRVSNGDASLTYTPSWRQEGFALSEDMPLRDQTYSPMHRRHREPAAAGSLDDSRPDRWGEKVIRTLYKKGATLRDNLYLAGDDRFGALGVSGSDTAYEPFNRQPLPRLHDVPTLAEAAAVIQSGEGELNAQRRDLLGAGGSLGGAKPKAVVNIDGEEWVVKFFDGEPWDQPLVEHACMTLAQTAGVRVAQTRVIKLPAEHAIAVRRFDRVGNTRVHSVSASTLLRAATPQGEEPQYGYPHLARRLRALGNVQRLDEHLQDLFRRMAFNILIANTDDHEKNHAVTHELINGAPVVNLSDAYDVVTTGSGAFAHEFMIADDVVDPDLEAAISVHRDFGLDEAQARHAISEVVRVVDGWRDHFTALGVTTGDMEALAEFIDSDELQQQRDRHRQPTARPAPRKRRSGTPKIFR
ncbi:type II toxin-antitoxin system HipA family toxin [Hydrogenophaga sp.]|uniref:type II toxin-antitoxin system HipA family toxin n=1 Tax=Hydrogenophaga sp. TaxID=1904254 RepID=UPI002731F593|nr:type II toxin-antitoxin system HipA family toxin [Hydrogenophaga sp.]MDP2016373.1 type II toxin-antitoxin system HipA family toxin [Hydrogenophaga sp.]MDP3166130.1 type II toxin-antitoxin system HipA family toxin [Hydrogenophaga sp.]MDP3812371.1 type II toxin-antitoxin system HipA family toxin [Hydrogenophaga sp.]